MAKVKKPWRVAILNLRTWVVSAWTLSAHLKHVGLSIVS